MSDHRERRWRFAFYRQRPWPRWYSCGWINCRGGFEPSSKYATRRTFDAILHLSWLCWRIYREETLQRIDTHEPR
jgi:hypothetical protein